MQELSYTLDTEGRIVTTSDGWNAHQLVLAKAAMSADHIIGRSIWNLISDSASRAMLRQIVMTCLVSKRCFMLRFASTSLEDAKKMVICVTPETGGTTTIYHEISQPLDLNVTAANGCMAEQHGTRSDFAPIRPHSIPDYFLCPETCDLVGKQLLVLVENSSFARPRTPRHYVSA